MKFIFAAPIAVLPVCALAEEAEGRGLMQQGIELFLEGLQDEMAPAIEGMGEMAREFGPAMAELMREMGPAFAALLERVDDLSNYEPPVILPNGDILIRRKPEAPELPEVGEGGVVDL